MQKRFADDMEMFEFDIRCSELHFENPLLEEIDKYLRATVVR
jgi:hypothetical protein